MTDNQKEPKKLFSIEKFLIYFMLTSIFIQPFMSKHYIISYAKPNGFGSLEMSCSFPCLAPNSHFIDYDFRYAAEIQSGFTRKDIVIISINRIEE